MSEQQPEIVKEYTNGEITVVWKPATCIHSKRCWTELRSVFNPKDRPWVHMDGATTDRIIEQVDNCPSKALTYYRNETGRPETDKPEVTVENIIEPLANGPLLVYGNLLVKNTDGTETRCTEVTAFCRCGSSANKPYCDGTHVKIGFSA